MQITDPLSDALHAVASQVKKLKARPQKLEGGGVEIADAEGELEETLANDYQI